MRLHAQGQSGLKPFASLFLADPWRLRADLHCHSYFSDGVCAPSELVAMAKVQGVELFALTDHDSLKGQDEARAAAVACDLAWVSGVEVSVTWANQTIHILGLGFDPHDPVFVSGLDHVRAQRLARAQAIDRSLAQAGLPGALEAALERVREPEQISRTHIARWIAGQRGYSDLREVFARYLCDGKPGDVPQAWASLRDSVGWIRAAGGVAVLAHPARYRLSPLLQHCLIEEFREAGGLALETASGSHGPREVQHFSRLASQYRLRASAGSDFHAPGESRTALGAVSLIADSVEPLWSKWAVNN
ncbi:MAG: PHP domain-containing protein [Betaproteobacteria bacterium]|jgi:predicted metal-dependent phosphoesterase TrpH|nr:PHP domain-containing protein [Betaproteobacteria bacterium]NBQ95444.1 PHP domain-containing protein [Betaproteobacteria bacterium]